VIPLSELDWDEDAMQFLQRGLQRYMDEIFDAILEGDDRDMVTESGEPFCGCETCYVRETLAFLLPRLVYMFIKGQVRLQHTYKENRDGLQLVSNGGELQRQSEGVS